MKRVILILCFLPLIGWGQPSRGVIEMPGESAAHLYKRLQSWYRNVFKGEYSTIESEDPYLNKIVGWGINYVSDPMMDMYYEMRVEAKQGRYFYSVSLMYVFDRDGTRIEYGLLSALSRYSIEQFSAIFAGDGFSREYLLKSHAYYKELHRITDRYLDDLMEKFVDAMMEEESKRREL